MEENPIIHLFDVYVKINKDLKDFPEDAKENPIDLEAKAIFKKMEDGMKTFIMIKVIFLCFRRY